jgi:hypothetical protein
MMPTNTFMEVTNERNLDATKDRECYRLEIAAYFALK